MPVKAKFDPANAGPDRSDAGQDGTPKPFLMIIAWIKVGKDWKVAAEIILPVPPTPGVKG
jgi:hypothetical protein